MHTYVLPKRRCLVCRDSLDMPFPSERFRIGYIGKRGNIGRMTVFLPTLSRGCLTVAVTPMQCRTQHSSGTLDNGQEISGTFDGPTLGFPVHYFTLSVSCSTEIPYLSIWTAICCLTVPCPVPTIPQTDSSPQAVIPTPIMQRMCVFAISAPMKNDLYL